MTPGPAARDRSEQHTGRLGQELAHVLLWPGLLRAAALAGRPQRVGLALLVLVVGGVLTGVESLWVGDEPGLFALAWTRLGEGVRALGVGARALAPMDVARALARLAGVPAALVRERPIGALVVGLPTLATGAIVGVAVARSVAEEYAAGAVAPWPRVLAFGLARWRAAIGSVAIIPAGVAGVALLLAAMGWVLLSLPGVRVIGAVLFGLAVGLGLLATLLTLGGMVAGPLLQPAVACEDADAFDAMQRALAYGASRPARLMGYLAFAGIVGAIVGVVLAGIARVGVDLAFGAATAFLSDADAAALAPSTGERSATAAGSIVSFWCALPGVAVWAYVLSYAWTSSTLVYLFIREICDGQDRRELWFPGRTEEVVAAAMRERASLARTAGEEDELDG